MWPSILRKNTYLPPLPPCFEGSAAATKTYEQQTEATQEDAPTHHYRCCYCSTAAGTAAGTAMGCPAHE